MAICMVNPWAVGKIDVLSRSDRTTEEVEILFQTEDKKFVIKMNYTLRKRNRNEPEIDKIDLYLDRGGMRFYPVKYKQEYDLFWQDLPSNFRDIL